MKLNFCFVDCFSCSSHCRLTGDGTDHTTSSSKLVHAQKVEPLTVAELNQYVIIADPQQDEVCVILAAPDVQRNFFERYLPSHVSHTYPFPYNRYRVILTVSDATDTAAFLGFDMEVAKLRNIQASEAAQIPEVVATGSDAKVDNTCCVTEAPSTSDGSLAGRKASAKEQIALDENPP
ncbi:unnamed protein product [Brassica rapa subsp. trilocularis]